MATSRKASKVYVPQSSFAAGELAPSFWGRVDRDIYGSGAAKLRNVYVSPSGGVKRRPGSKYIANTTTNQAARLISFQFNISENYLLSFTPGEMKVYKNDVLQATVTSSPISTLTADIIANMNYVQSLNTLIIVHPDIQPIQVLRVSDTSWTPSSITISSIPTYDFGSGAEAVWSVTRGWPRSATFWNQRLWFGGSKSRPSTLWGSKIAGFFDFDLGTGADADAIEATIDEDQVNEIEAVFAGRTLQIFTSSAEYFLPIGSAQTVTPGTVRIERGTLHGSGKLDPVSSDGATLFVDRSGRVVREYVFLDVEQSYVSDDVSFLAEHLIRSPVAVGIQKSQENIPGEYTYFVNSDGTIAVLNRRRQQNFIAWSLWETDGVYESLSVTGNKLYVVSKRSINGSDVRFIERFDFGYYTDAGTIITVGAATTTFTGLSYLEGEEVSVRSQGDYPLLKRTVASGEIEIEFEETSIEVGMPWRPIVRTLAPISSEINIAGSKRRILAISFHMNNSNGFLATNGRTTLTVPLTQFGSIYFNQPVPKFTGWYRQPFLGHTRDPYIEIYQENPVDFELLSMVMEVTV